MSCNVVALQIGDRTSLRHGLDQMNKAGEGILLVVDGNQKLLGILTDGDVRRAILAGANLDDPVVKWVNSEFVSWQEDEPRPHALGFMRARSLRHLPVVNSHGQVIEVISTDEIEFFARDNPVIIFCGGRGKRLQPLTNDTPKPMLHVGQQPLLDKILQRLVEQGFRNFYFSVHYRAEQIEEYFGDGARWGVSIRYLHEQNPLGTAGGLSLLPEKPRAPMLVMNGDLLTTLDFGALLADHTKSGYAATICVREYEYQVPYGVIETIANKVVRIVEKPTRKVLVSAGIYVLNPACLDLLSRNTYTDMPHLFDMVLARQLPVGYFPVDGVWLDIGRMHDFHQAQVLSEQISG